MADTSVRAWATPLTIGAFLLMSGSGVLMFFEWDRGLTTVAHQWFSWLFLLGAGGHMVANFRPLANHLRSRRGKASLVTFALILAASLHAWGLVTGPQLKRPIEEALIDARLSTLAEVAHIDADALLRRLQAQGIHATREQSMREIAMASGVGENRLLGMVFLPP